MATENFDIIVTGGGITGAGVFHEAAARGYRTLLLEARDFAWGTSSRSSKMVHGGLRYLGQGHLKLTRDAVKERERLLKRYPGLVTAQEYIMPVFRDYGPGEWMLKLGLSIYSFMAGKKQHQVFSARQALDMFPALRREHLKSALGFKDAQVDDARLVLRLIQDGMALGGVARNYTRVERVALNRQNRVCAVQCRHAFTGRSSEIAARVVVNATGASARSLCLSNNMPWHIRPLRGSHMVFPGHLFPLDRVLSFFHPQDLRPVFIFPWQGTLVLGTTDVDHKPDLDTEPVISGHEAGYLMDGLNHVLPGLSPGFKDCISTFAGVRPVLSSRHKPASRESREHMVWSDRGLVTVTGGKLTTFGILANDTLSAAGKDLPAPGQPAAPPAVEPDSSHDNCDFLSGPARERLYGRYGKAAGLIIRDGSPKTLINIPGTDTLWAELPFAAAHESIYTLADLLLRRTRIGLLLPHGGRDFLNEIQAICRPVLPWDAEQWNMQKKQYLDLWESAHAPPGNLKEGDRP